MPTNRYIGLHADDEGGPGNTASGGAQVNFVQTFDERINRTHKRAAAETDLSPEFLAEEKWRSLCDSFSVFRTLLLLLVVRALYYYHR